MADKLELDSLDSAKYLYLRELSEPQDNSLRFVREAVVNPAGSVFPHPDAPELDEILRDGSPIESTDACRTFELMGNRYVAYLVTEECVGPPENITTKFSLANCFASIRSRIFLSILHETLAATPRKSYITS